MMIVCSRLLFDKGASILRPSAAGISGGLSKECMTRIRRGMSSVPYLNPILYGVPSTYSDEDWEPVQKFVDESPILYKVPTDRLINVQPEKPFMVTEKGKVLLWSAALIPFLSHLQGRSTTGVFQDGSLAVLKPLGVLGVREFTNVTQAIPLDKNDKDLVIRSNNGELREYLITLLQKYHGKEIETLLLADLNHWLNSMKAPVIELEMIAFPAALLPRDERGVLGMDIHRHLRKEMPLLGDTSKGLATEILASIPDRTALFDWRARADKNPFLHLWRTHKFTGNTQTQQKENSPQINTPPRNSTEIPDARKKHKHQMNEESPNSCKEKRVSSSLSGKRKGVNSSSGKQKLGNNSSDNKQKGGNNSNGNKKKGNRNYNSFISKKKGDRSYSSSSMGKGKGKGKNSSSQKGNLNVKRQNGERIRRNKKRQKFLLFLGASIVDHHRNSYAHIFEEALIEAIKEFDDKQRESLMKNPYTDSDVLDLLNYEYPEYLPLALCAIKKFSPELWEKINMRGRFKLPMSLYR